MERLQGKDLLTRYKRALEGLTPGGSEFVDDPERCAENVKRSREGLMQNLRSRVKQIHEITEREKELLKALEICLTEINEHNAEYQHYTKPEVLEPIMHLISQCKAD